MQKFLFSLLVCPCSLLAATLYEVPMQGGMLMPMIAYHADEARLRVMMPTGPAQLTPLLISHPADGFDPEDPWFANLDPAAQGYAFTRRYGFVMAVESEPLPPHTEMWIRKLSASPHLAFYRYNKSAPKAWEPIFGTAGSSTARYWSGMMFHPGVSAPPADDASTATFEVYLVDSSTQAEISGSGTGPFVLEFTNVADGRPSLEIRPMPAVSWPAEATGWGVEYADSLDAATWTPMTNAPTIVEGKPALLIDTNPAGLYFRMRRLP